MRKQDVTQDKTVQPIVVAPKPDEVQLQKMVAATELAKAMAVLAESLRSASTNITIKDTTITNVDTGRSAITISS